MAKKSYKDMYNIKIFKLNRIKFEEMWEDAMSYLKKKYDAVDQFFSAASPMGQLLQTFLHLARMIFYYIEDSITGLNIKTAYREDQIKGLATLTGHDAGRAMSARGLVKVSYRPNASSEYSGRVCYIPNKIGLSNKLNGRNYVMLFSADVAKMTLQLSNYIEASVIEGQIKYQKATSNGMQLQSYNFTERNYAEIDQLFVNVYVNGTLWEKKESLLDLGFNEKACIVRTGAAGGIDVFFGNGFNGCIPEKGSIIMVEYISSSGFIGNIGKDIMSSDDYWEFQDNGFLSDKTEIDLNEYLKVTSTSDIIFGTDPENISLTQKIAPYASRSMVLANETNYKYFFSKMNMFSIIEVISGYNTFSDSQANANLLKAKSAYSIANDNYATAISQFGPESDKAMELYGTLCTAQSELSIAEQEAQDASLDDNCVYLMLIPDITKRISSSVNYFTCNEDAFVLSKDEQKSLLSLIDESKQRILTVENRIISPKLPRFAINASIKMWDNYKFEDVYNSALDALSNYLLTMNRRDMIPLSDIVALFENVDGIDSVKVSFDADVKNSAIYGEDDFYGIDEFGDILLYRTVIDSFSSEIHIRDIFPLFRGGFVSPSGISYSNEQSMNEISAFNLSLSGTTTNRTLSIADSTPLN